MRLRDFPAHVQAKLRAAMADPSFSIGHYAGQQAPSADRVRNLTVRLPWSALASDNRRHGVVMRNGRPRLVLTEFYRERLEAARLVVMGEVRRAAPFAAPVCVEACFFEPDRQRSRDIANYSKLLHDALIGVAVVDDSLIDDVRYIRAGVDARDPRVVLTLTLLSESATDG